MLTNFKDRLFHINSDDSEVLRKGRLLHFLVIFTVVISVSGVIVHSIQQFWFDRAYNYFRPFIIIFPVALGLATAIFWLTRRGRILRAAHLFTGGLNLSLFLVLIFMSDSNNVYFVPYLMLIGIVAVAALDRVPASIFYTAVTGTAVSIFYIISVQYNIIDIIVYLLTLAGVSATFWITAGDLKSLNRSAKKLSQEIQFKNDLLEERAAQLQISAEISQKTGQSLELKTLLKRYCSTHSKPV
jgi:hypothetical protein